MDHLAFLQQEIPMLIGRLQPTTTALWGSMLPQHMIEHLIVAVKSSYGRLPAIPMADEGKMALRKERFFSNNVPMPRHVRVNFAPEVPGDFHFAEIEEAKHKLLTDLTTFFQYYRDNPEKEHLHPVFGMLNGTEWTEVHARHFLHHFKQFGLIPLGPEDLPVS